MKKIGLSKKILAGSALLLVGNTCWGSYRPDYDDLPGQEGLAALYRRDGSVILYPGMTSYIEAYQSDSTAILAGIEADEKEIEKRRESSVGADPDRDCCICCEVA
jgi:hypothetical protein